MRRIVEAFRDSIEPATWTTTEWVLQELGYALGLSKPVILALEHGVLFPGSYLDGDRERLQFSRANIHEVEQVHEHDPSQFSTMPLIAPTR